MAHSLCSQSPFPASASLPPLPSNLHNRTFNLTIKPKRVLIHLSKPHIPIPAPKNGSLRAAQDSESKGNTEENQSQSTNLDSAGGGDDDAASRLGSEIRQAMEEQQQKEPGFWGGVAAETREIEWPPFKKVLGTTGVVLGVIAGSSVVLLTVNAVLAELSDRVFAGKGVQDFFS